MPEQQVAVPQQENSGIVATDGTQAFDINSMFANNQ